jgi:hypothetical protein
LDRAGIKLVRHQDETFRSQTIHVAGNGYVNCTFDACTFVVTNAPFHMLESRISRDCNWRIEIDLLAGDPLATHNIHLLLQIIEGPDRANRRAATRAAAASKATKASARPEKSKQK